jgi:ppGpp synthetase/RelA/SpoT-type nucleotidyltranferase
MLNKSKFLEKFKISDESFEKSKCDWEELKAIFYDFISKEQELLVAGNLILERLRLIKEIHSLKIRIKDPEHLIEKIIRKREENPERNISIDNYSTEITDLIGVRALHLFKDEWISIHDVITKIWDGHEPPTAYIRTGDPEKYFKDNGCEIKAHKAGYRSVHYLIKTQPTKLLHIAEIQVRTIFEEGWSEIDHRLRYPYDINNELLNEYLQIFNRLAGSADEMGSYIKTLKCALTEREKHYEKERDQFNNEKEAILKEMEKLKGRLKSEAKDKEELQKIIDTLKKSNIPSYGIDISKGILGSSYINKNGMATILDQHSEQNGIGSIFVTGSKKCNNCGYSFQGGLGILGASGICPNCGKRIL